MDSASKADLLNAIIQRRLCLQFGDFTTDVSINFTIAHSGMRTRTLGHRTHAHTHARIHTNTSALLTVYGVENELIKLTGN
jgi:hypothetical protein